nr:proline-rich receptor-like protein kinase PERK1 [Tanacetum cinerariifolium]
MCANVVRPIAHFVRSSIHTEGKKRPLMKFPIRLRITLGTAKGLAYLHEDCILRSSIGILKLLISFLISNSKQGLQILDLPTLLLMLPFMSQPE